MVKKIIKVIACIMLVVGIGLVAFPPISNFIGNMIANSETNRFDEEVDNMIDDKTYQQALDDGDIDKEGYPIDENGKRTSNTPFRYKADIERLMQDSIEYNNTLKTQQNSLLTSEYSYEQPSLDLTSYGIYDGIYGYVTAESINMNLPIYLGANNSNMSYGAAHLTYTSLPTGGSKTNSVLAGHTGYIGRIFFDNIRNLQIGDTVTLTNYWTKLNYKVVGTEIYKPTEWDAIFINDNRDLLTMFTCISDGNGGFNRYYVICERIDKIN
jgi:sortase A